MAFIALLDAKVLVNAAVRDTLLRAAEANLYQLAISADILDEMRRALEGSPGRTRQQTDYLVLQMMNSFESALVEGYESLIPVMENHEGDRHALAAAVRAGAEAIVTFNLLHFSEKACKPHCVETQHLDEFLLVLWNIDAPLMALILEQQAATINWELSQLVDRLRKDAPRFIAAVESSGLLGWAEQAFAERHL